MPPRLSASRIVWYETIAFASIILVTWLNEFCGLEGIVFGQAGHPPDWRNPFIETVVILLAGIPTVLLSAHFARRLRHLEGFMKVCAWCHRVGHDDEWIGLEDYIKKTFNTETTHGICPSCSRKLRASHRPGGPFSPREPEG